MSNQSFVQIPVDLTSEIELRRLLTSIVEQIDLISGNRAQSPFVLESEQVVDDTNIVALSDKLSALALDVNEIVKDINDNTDDVTTLQTDYDSVKFTITHQPLGSIYLDFNDAAWNALQGHGQIEGLGSTFSNPPYVLTGASNYIFYVDSATTVTTGVTQRVIVEDTTAGALRVFVRAGDTITTLFSNGWLEL